MKLEQQVCSLELSKKLKQLGLNKESYFLWLEIDTSTTTLNHDTIGGIEWILIPSDSIEVTMAKGFAAFTVAELGERLPSILEFEDTEPDQYLQSGKLNEHCWDICYVNAHNIQINDATCAAENEADARAKMLIYLIENNLLKP